MHHFNKLFRRALLAGVAFTVAAVGAAAWMRDKPTREAKDAVRAALKDPGSAQFQEVTTFTNGAACGRVNAKNGFGGYDGFREFVIFPGGKVNLIPADADAEWKHVYKLMAESLCREK